MVTTVATSVRDAPHGAVIVDLPAGIRVRLPGEAKHKAFPVTVPGSHIQGWIARADLAPLDDHAEDVSGGATHPGDHPGANQPEPGAPTGDVGARIAAEARNYIGFPYMLGRQGPNEFDCSGLVQYVVRRVSGQTVSADSHALFNLPQHVDRAHLQPGDLVFYDTQNGTEVREGNAISHVGIIVGPSRMVNALNAAMGVRESDPFSPYFAPLYRGARRIF
jgi:cell wall-associated NlpC family hydrolase